MARFVLILLVFSVACQAGREGCPEVKVRKLRKTPFRGFIDNQHRSASADTKYESRNQDYTQLRERTPALQHVSVDEWDCPKPGMKKAPKAVKENIRKNTKRIKSYFKNRNQADTLRMVTPNPLK